MKDVFVPVTLSINVFVPLTDESSYGFFFSRITHQKGRNFGSVVRLRSSRLEFCPLSSHLRAARSSSRSPSQENGGGSRRR